MDLPPPRRPDREGEHLGLAYSLWLPEATLRAPPDHDPSARPVPAPPWPGMLVLHGAGSRKENHADFARLCAAAGWAALAFDARGHGASEGEMTPAALDDAISMARFLAGATGVDPGRIAVRGSSMGGFIALHAAALAPEIAGVIAICPAGKEHLSRGIRRGELEMRVGDETELEA